MSLADTLDGETLRGALSGQQIGHRIVVLEEATSTNDALAQLAPTSDEGVVVIAERQTAGRGQYGRRWESAPHTGLWLSVLLRPNIAVTESARLTDLLAKVIAATIRTTLGIVASIKPPNDVYISTRKIAGVLVEMRAETGGGYYAVAGAGVNVNHAPGDFPEKLRDTAGSLAIAAGKRINRAEFLVALLTQLEARYSAFRREYSATQL